MIAISIDVTLLDKTKFKRVTRKNGKDAVFCEIVLIETPNGQYGDYMCKQGQSKEDREARVETPILGNGKIIQKGQGGRRNEPKPPAASSEPEPNDEQVPF